MFSTFEFTTFLKILVESFAAGMVLCIGLNEIFGFRFDRKPNKEE